MSAHIFSGAPGVGKTYTGTALVLEALDRGLRVAVNWEIAPPADVNVLDLRREGADGGERRPVSVVDVNVAEGPVVIRYDEYSEIIGLADAVVFNDEAQATSGARDWESMTKRTRLWLSMHRHYRLTLIFLTQHYKFIDVYYRRLGVGNVRSMTRLLNLTLLFPRPDADPELGELGSTDVLGVNLIWRPWKDLDHEYLLPGFWRLLKFSKLVPQHYATHQPRDEGKKKTA